MKNINVKEMINKIENEQMRNEAEKIFQYVLDNRDNLGTVLADITANALPPVVKLIVDASLSDSNLLDRLDEILNGVLNDDIEVISTMDMEEASNIKIIVDAISYALDKLYPPKDSVIKLYLENIQFILDTQLQYKSCDNQKFNPYLNNSYREII